MSGALVHRLGLIGAPASAPFSIGRSTGNTSSSCAINRLHLLRVTAGANATLTVGHFISSETDVSARVKCCLYDGDATIPANKLAESAEQVGISNGVQYDLAYLASAAIVNGQVYWVGIHVGTSAATLLLQNGLSSVRWVTSNTATYGSGVPAAYPGTTSGVTTSEHAFWATGTTP